LRERREREAEARSKKKKRRLKKKPTTSADDRPTDDQPLFLSHHSSRFSHKRPGRKRGKKETPGGI